MLYLTNDALPASVRDHLPVHARSIYREAFNQAFASHGDELDCEVHAHRIAWAAVKRTYKKRSGVWVSR